jgi:hypothetical protein
MISLLSDIVESNSLSAVLAFLMIAPARTFTAKELSMRVGLSAEKVNQALEELDKQNYVKVFSSNGVEYFRLNLRHAQVLPLQAELLKIEKPWQDELYTALKKVGQMQGIFLSGIFVAQPLLPVDILLVGKANLTKLDEFLKMANKLMNRELNYSIMSPEEFTSRKDTFDRFIKDIFDYHHLVVVDNLQTPSAKSKTKPKKK